MKKIILSLVLAVAASALFAAPTFADDYTITVASNQATKNQDLIFQYLDIAPGFKADAPINIVNQATSSAEIKLIKIEPIDQPVAPKPAPANNMLPYINLSLSRDGATLAQGTAGNTASLIGATFCVPAAQTTELMSHFELPASVGNAAQNTSLNLRYSFQITVGPCSIVAPPDTSGNGTAVNPPNTSETSLPFLVMGGTCLSAFLMALLFATFLLIPLLKKRRKNGPKFARQI